MRARVLVLIVSEDERTDLVMAQDIGTHAADGEIFIRAWEDDALDRARRLWGDAIDAHGFVDIEIPDDVIAQVLRRQADAGPVKAEPVVTYCGATSAHSPISVCGAEMPCDIHAEED